MTKSLLSNLPEELISHIFEQLVHDKPDLLNVALVSKQVNRIVTPFIYRHISLEKSRKDGLMFQEIHFSYLRSLTSFLLRRPEVAAAVQKLTVRPNWSAWGTMDIREADLVVVDPIFIPRLKELAEGDKETLGRLRRYVGSREAEDLIMALLLPALPNLKSLDIMHPKLEGLKVLSIENLRRKKKALSQLEELMVTWWLRSDEVPYFEDLLPDFRNTRPPKEILPFFRLPRIRRLFVFAIGDSDIEYSVDENAFSEEDPGNVIRSSIEHLEMRDASCRPETLSGLLTRCIRLHTFVYEIGTPVLIAPQDIIRGLSLHADTLKNLWLDHQYPRWSFDLDDTIALSFAGFSNLEHLKVAAAFLFGDYGSEEEPGFHEHIIHSMPGKLRRLAVVNSQSFIEEPWLLALEGLFDSRTARFPNLHEFTLQGGFLYEQWEWLSLRRLKIRSEVNGITFKAVCVCPADPCEDAKGEERGWGMDEEIRWAPCVGWGNRWETNTEIGFGIQDRPPTPLDTDSEDRWRDRGDDDDEQLSDDDTSDEEPEHL